MRISVDLIVFFVIKKTTTMKILVVEDEQSLNTSICSYLDSEKYQCKGVLNKFDAEDALLLDNYVLLILDINLPDGSGLDLLKWVRQQGLNLGIIIISAREAQTDRIEGLDTGADDYITKPFHLSELNARIKALLRRRKFNNEISITFNELENLTEEMTFKVGGTQIDLTPKQYKIVEFFLSNPNKVISKEMLAEYIWKGSAIDHDNLEFIYNHVMNIRNMINNMKKI